MTTSIIDFARRAAVSARGSGGRKPGDLGLPAPACLARRAIGWLALLALAVAPHPALAGVNAWTTAGPRMEWPLVAADPRPGGTVYIDARGRPFRSTDRGAHWTPVEIANTCAFDFQAFWFDPNVAHRVYAAVDTMGGGGSSVLQVVRSDDDGASWTKIGEPFAQFGRIGEVIRARRLAISTSDARRIYASSVRGFAVSLDAGASWTSVSSPGVSILDFALDPSSPGTIYGVGETGVWRSLDDGATWAPRSSSRSSSSRAAIADRPGRRPASGSAPRWGTRRSCSIQLDRPPSTCASAAGWSCRPTAGWSGSRFVFCAIRRAARWRSAPAGSSTRRPSISAS